VLPLHVGSKEPLGRSVLHGYLDASCDLRILTRWWRSTPRANVGIACAPSGLLVVDVDPRNGGDETLAHAQLTLGELPRTWTVLTPGGGAHYYFRCKDTVHFVPLGPGIDLKCLGYVVAPPSIHPNGGRYLWDLGAHPLEAALATLPPAWRDRLTRSARARQYEHDGIDAEDSFLGVAFDAVGWLGASLLDGRRFARCPWHHLHTDGRGQGYDSSTVLFPPMSGSELGAFHCSHAHCAGRRLVDVLEVLPPEAMDAASRVFRKAYRVVLRRLAKERRGHVR